MITDAAATALTLHPDIAPGSPDAHLQRHRARIARHIVAMLGVPPSHVHVSDDADRHYSTHPGDLVTVHDPHDPNRRYRFVPEPSHGGLFYLLDDCPLCDSNTVPVAVIATLHDLAHYLAAAGRLTAHGIDDATAPEVPAAFYGDTGHRPGCPSSSGPCLPAAP